MLRKFTAVIIITLTVVVLSYYFNILLNNNKIITIIDNNNNEVNYELEEYIIGVVACEMPALYEPEALKAQAIAARTYASYQNDYNKKLKTDSADQCYITKEEMKDKWNNDYETYYNKIKTIVKETNGLVMTKNDELFKSFYFSTSNGYTEDSQTVFKEQNIKSVESPWDKKTKNYTKTIEYTKENIENLLGPFETIEIISRNETNHVEKVKVDDKLYTGIEFRKKLNLRSTDFNITIKDNKYIITTYGYGHGVGMSQTGANELAKLGYDYKYILNYYYNEVELKNLYV